MSVTAQLAAAAAAAMLFDLNSIDCALESRARSRVGGGEK